MPDDDNLDRRVRKLAVEHAETRWLTLRLDDDVKELRDQLRAVRATQQEHGARFDSIDSQLQEHGARLDSIDGQLQEHGARLDSIDGQLQEHGARLGSIDGQLQEHGARFDSIGAQLRSLTQLVGQVLERLPDGEEPRM
jgi:chromosome segregation ATPase